MKSYTVKTFSASATFGLQKGYTEEIIQLNVFKRALNKAQQAIYEKEKMVLSTKLSLCHMICLGQDEPSVTLDWIQYPKFQMAEDKLKTAILNLVNDLMLQLEQNRVVVIFHDETICLEQGSSISPRINLEQNK